MVLTPLPNTTVQTSSGAVVGGGSLTGGLVCAFAGSFPTGPVFDPNKPANCLMSSPEQCAKIYGSEFAYNDLAGWSGPPAAAIFWGEAEGTRPQALILRAGTTQATVSIATLSSINAALLLGGADGNGTTFVVAAPVSGNQTITITPPAGNVTNAQPETYTVASGATWQTVANTINPQSKLVSLTVNAADQATAIPSSLTTSTLAGGTAGANATANQINTAINQLGNLLYSVQPVQACVPLMSDGASTGVTLNALGTALSAQANGQRFQVIGAADRSLGQGSSAVSAILAVAATLVPSENGGDSGRCTFLANNYPYRIDPATNNERLYPPAMVAAGYAGKVCSLLPYSTPRTRHRFSKFTRFGEGYLPGDIQTLYSGTGGQGGALAAYTYGMLASEVTTAIGTSYRRTNAVQTCEDVWTADLANTLNQAVLGTAATAAAGQSIDNLCEQALRGYVAAAVLLGASVNVQQDSNDYRNWTVTVQWNPILPIQQITLKAQLTPLPAGSGVAVATF